MGIWFKCMWMKRFSETVVKPSWTERTWSNRGDCISWQHLGSAMYIQALHTSGVLTSHLASQEPCQCVLHLLFNSFLQREERYEEKCWHAYWYLIDMKLGFGQGVYTVQILGLTVWSQTLETSQILKRKPLVLIYLFIYFFSWHA